MRICFYTQDVSSHLGGVQSVVALVSAILTELGHEITILCPDSGIEPKQQRKLNSAIRLVRVNQLSTSRSTPICQTLSKVFLATVKRFPWKKDFRLLNPVLKWAVLRSREHDGVLEYLEQEKFDVVVAAGPTQSLFLSLLPHLGDTRKVGWQHSTYSAYFETRGKALFGLQKLAQLSYPTLDAVLVLNTVDQHLFDRKLSVSSDVFPNPVQVPDRSETAAHEEKAIVFLGRINFSVKGLDLLVESFAKVVAGHPDWMLNVYGDGPDSERLATLVKDRGLSANVRLLGVTDKPSEALASGSIFVFPSRYEGFGIALVEAMRMGLPSVSFATDGPRDILKDSVTGFLVRNHDTEEFANRISQLIEKPEIRRSMGAKAKQAAEAYDPELLVPEFLRIIDGDS